MAHIEMFMTPTCPYCQRARALLDRKGVAYEMINVAAEPQLRDVMEKRARRHTVPQIFIDDRHIGGCDDLYALDAAGGLDPLLQG
ncbi:glutaredoxin 3 [Insolitispirillum peregrinum]|uniref:glutaredoxin 3 n=1 Tax=Insolitispirillum peregrinum TaxID=80876 RepID=UPI00361E4771